MGAEIALEFVDPWSDPRELLNANPIARVPTLLTDDGHALTETLLIVQWLESTFPGASLLGTSSAVVLSGAGVAMGVIDAAAHTFMGRRVAPEFDETAVGVRRRRAMVNGLLVLESRLPDNAGESPNIADIATTVALDYLRFRFSAAGWLPAVPRLDAICSRLAERPTFRRSAPREISRS
ncbi:Glutathione S-transferase family protein [Paraburkholderia tropica]|nr:Glutathione S-transferase family protein [Paraburkholderia tropica]